MPAFLCPDCGGSNLIDYYDPDFLECQDCGLVSFIDDCRVKPRIDEKKSKFDDEEDYVDNLKVDYRELSEKLLLEKSMKERRASINSPLIFHLAGGNEYI